MADNTHGRAVRPDDPRRNASGEPGSESPHQPLPADEPAAGAAGEAQRPKEDEDSLETLEQAQARADENWNKYLRATADADNIRKRASRDLEHARRYGVERFSRELLAVLDSLEMGLEMGQGAGGESGATVSVESLLEGKKATLKLLRSAMKKFEIEELDPEGEVFDPQLHEAISTVPSETVEPGSVVTVVQKGYRIYDRLLRPALVVVAAEKG